MEKTVFIDSDILFQFFALNKKKREKYYDIGTTGDKDLDLIVELIEEIERNNQKIMISEISILEILCTLNRLNSAHKSPEIITKIYKICEISPLDALLVKLSWYIGSNYDFHSGDALHIAFCLSNNIEKMILKDKEFYDSCLKIKEDYSSSKFQKFEEFFVQIPFAKGIPKKVLNSFSNIKNMTIKRIGNIE